MPSYLWPMTSPPPILARYRLVISGSYACFTSMYIQNLPAAYASVVIWRLVCTSNRPSLASYGVSHFLASHSLKPAPFRGWAFAWPWLFLLKPTLLLFSAIFACLAVLLYHSCCGVNWPKPTGPIWACCLFFSQWLSIVIWAFLVTLSILGPFTFLGPFWPFS